MAFCNNCHSCLHPCGRNDLVSDVAHRYQATRFVRFITNLLYSHKDSEWLINSNIILSKKWIDICMENIPKLNNDIKDDK